LLKGKAAALAGADGGVAKCASNMPVREVARRPIPMTLHHTVWALNLLLSAQWSVFEVISGIAHHGKESWGRGRCLRLGISCVPLLLTGWVYLSAACCVSNLRRLGTAFERWDRVEVERYFADRVQVGVKEYARGPALLDVHMRPPPKNGTCPTPGTSGSRDMGFRPCLDPSDPKHLYV
jgi:hypothetical protein